MGDFNMIPESEEYNRIVGKSDPCNGRVAHVDGFLGSWTVAKAQLDDRITWFPDPPERAPGHPICLDYCFISPYLAQRVDRVWIDQDAIGSDHKPYWVDLDF
jgi:endonuclease/exonuclease/phosphatase family metal-dependent hydrolase